ncbi:MAG: SRPBCC family protein [Moraxellaceae bacterium]
MLKITVQTTVNASLERVWSAWTTPADINQWNAASDDWHNPSSRNDLKVGGRFCYRMEARDGSMGFDFEGTYTRVEPEQLIEYVMDDGRAVSIRFEPTADGISVIESFDAENENSAEMQKQGWQSILNRFNAHIVSKK